MAQGVWMSRFTFVHAADLHLDTPFSGLSRVSEALASRLRDASLDAFDRLVQLCLDERAAFLLLAGDLYDGAERGLRAQLRVLRGLTRLSEAGIRTFIVHGNHDPLDGWSAIDTWPPGVHVFGARSVEVVPVEWREEVIATVQGISYGVRDVRENLALRYRRPALPGVHIGLLHANLDADALHDSYAPCTRADLLASGLDYWALGHIHKRQAHDLGRTWAVYPGNLQGRSPKPSEQGPKGAYVVQVADGVFTAPRFVALDRWRFETVSVDIAGVDNFATLVDVITQKGGQLRAAAGDDRGLIVRVRLEGAGPLASELNVAVRLNELLLALRDQSDDDLWWESLHNDTRLMVDMAALRGRSDFIGALLTTSEAWRCDAALLQKVALEQFGGLERFGVPLPAAAEMQELLAEAEQLALYLMLEEGR
jgi:exonuclease SbcD